MPIHVQICILFWCSDLNDMHAPRLVVYYVDTTEYLDSIHAAHKLGVQPSLLALQMVTYLHKLS